MGSYYYSSLCSEISKVRAQQQGGSPRTVCTAGLSGVQPCRRNPQTCRETYGRVCNRAGASPQTSKIRVDVTSVFVFYHSVVPPSQVEVRATCGRGPSSGDTCTRCINFCRCHARLTLSVSPSCSEGVVTPRPAASRVRRPVLMFGGSARRPDSYLMTDIVLIVVLRINSNRRRHLDRSKLRTYY